jgi:hypothetical protein
MSFPGKPDHCPKRIKMDSNTIRIIAVFAGIAILYFILRGVSTWFRDLLGQGVGISKKLLIVTFLVVAFCFWQFPEATHRFFESVWEGLVEAYRDRKGEAPIKG